jgi:hypothetical protein
MLRHIDTHDKKVRLMGLTISNNEPPRLPPDGVQLRIPFKY